MERLLVVLLSAAGLAAIVWIFVVLPYHMAEQRRRRGWLYVLLSLAFSPMIILPLLWVIGGASRYRR